MKTLNYFVIPSSGSGSSHDSNHRRGTHKVDGRADDRNERLRSSLKEIDLLGW